MQLTNIEKKKKTANPERERFQGKSSGETAFTENDESLSPRDHAVGSADTIAITLCLLHLFNSKMRTRVVSFRDRTETHVLDFQQVSGLTFRNLSR